MTAILNTLKRPAWLDRQVVIIALVALLARVITFGNPIIDTDEEFYLVTAQSMLHGAIPYVDIWDRKPVGLFTLYLLPALFPGNGAYIAYQLMALLFVVATALVIGRLAKMAGWGSGAMAAALTYILWINLAEGQGGQSPVFYNLFMAGAAWATARVIGEARPGQRLAYGIAAMLLAGISLQVKYSVVFEGVFFGLFLLFEEWKARVSFSRIILSGLVLVVAALVPTAIALAVYAGLGHLDAFVFANFISIFARHAEPFSQVAGNFAVIAGIMAPLLTLAFWRLPPHKVAQEALPNARATGIFLKGWLISAILGLLLFGTYFVHYSLPVMVPAAGCAAAFFARHRRGAKTALILLPLIAVAGQVMVLLKERHRGNSEQVDAIVQEIGRGPGCLFDYSGHTLFYELTGRCHSSRYILSSHLNHMREAGAIGVPQETEVRRILNARPEVILMTPQSGENENVHRLVFDELAAQYHLEATLPLGKELYAIYRLNGAVSPRH
jgi:hypothetical protein